MRVVKTIDEVRAQVKEWRAQGLTVGLVPTMGYLHEGHASLIDASHRDNDRTVVSDFVNRTRCKAGRRTWRRPYLQSRAF